jgi:hypothetical protein
LWRPKNEGCGYERVAQRGGLLHGSLEPSEEVIPQLLLCK